MALITRLSRLLRADMHALLDRLEEPDIVLAQALREMEDAIAADEQALTSLKHQRSRLAEHSDVLARRHADDAKQLEVCLDAEQDDLARELLRRKLQRERLDAQLSSRSRELDSRIAAQATRLAECRQRLEQLRAEASVLADTDRAPVEPAQDAWSDLEADGIAPVRDADVEIALLAAKRGRSA
jgi:phage shock protein A